MDSGYDKFAAQPRNLTAAEIKEFAILRFMMRKDLYMTKEQRYRWFELWQRYDR